MKNGILLVLSAPAGCGKDTVLDGLIQKDEQIFYSVSATTRSRRKNEVEGVNYYFRTREQFESLIQSNELLEYTEYCGNYYGTPKEAVLDMLQSGNDVVLKIEVEGAANIKKMFPECVLVFLLPPSLEVLQERLVNRGTEDAETIKKRIDRAREELSFAKNYDYVVVNDKIEMAIKELSAILCAEKCRTTRNGGKIFEMLNGGVTTSKKVSSTTARAARYTDIFKGNSNV